MMLPHHRYLDHLLILDLPDDEVVRALELDDLVVPEPAELARARYDLADRPAGFDPLNPRHGPSQAWLREKKIASILTDKPGPAEAIRILRSPILRQPVEILTLGGHPPGLVPRFAADHDLPPVTEEGVAYYLHYLWDVGGLPTDAWAAFLRRLPRGEILMDVLGHGAQKALVVADIFVRRLQKVAVVSTLPGAGGGGGGYVRQPPMFIPKRGPEPGVVEAP